MDAKKCFHLNQNIESSTSSTPLTTESSTIKSSTTESSTTESSTTQSSTTQSSTTTTSTTQSSTTASTTTVKWKPIQGTYTYSFDIMTSLGSYLKTIYLVMLSYNTNDAIAYCTKNGMSLFKVLENDSANGYNDAILKFFPTTFGGGWNVDGTLDSNNVWVTKTSPHIPVFVNMTWGKPENTTFPPCMLARRDSDKIFKLYSSDCSALKPFMCEHS